MSSVGELNFLIITEDIFGEFTFVGDKDSTANIFISNDDKISLVFINNFKKTATHFYSDYNERLFKY